MLHKIIAEYYKHHRQCPESWAKFPKFYVVSPVEKFYLDSDMLAKGPFGGYRYTLAAYADGRFVVSASPSGFWLWTSEFGITENGILKENTKAVDFGEDGYAEVGYWPPYISKSVKKPDKTFKALDESQSTQYN